MSDQLFYVSMPGADREMMERFANDIREGHSDREVIITDEHTEVAMFPAMDEIVDAIADRVATKLEGDDDV